MEALEGLKRNAEYFREIAVKARRLYDETSDRNLRDILNAVSTNFDKETNGRRIRPANTNRR